MSQQMEKQLQRSGCVLQVWEVHGRLAAAWSQRLQMLQSEAETALGGALADDCSLEQVAARTHGVQVRRVSLFSMSQREKRSVLFT